MRPFRRAPATDAQIAELRRLATWPGLPPEAREHAEARIAKGLDVNEAYSLIGAYANRVRALNTGPVEAMAKDAKRLGIA